MYSGLEAVVSGRVQMVMFRDFTRRKALKLGVVGEIKNRPDGTVAVYAEGSEETLEKFVEFLKRGSAFSRVDNVAYTFVYPRGGFDSFFIKYT